MRSNTPSLRQRARSVPTNLSVFGRALSNWLYGCGRVDRIVDPTQKQIDGTRMQLFVFSSEKDRQSYLDEQSEYRCFRYLRSVLSGEETVTGFLWELYFEFLLYNEQDRFSMSDACRGYVQSLPLRLIVVCLCTFVLPLLLVLYAVLAPMCNCLVSAMRACITPCNEFISCRSSSGSEQMLVSADQYYEDRFRVVYDEAKARKRRLDHQHNVVLLTQMVLNVVAIYISDLPAVELVHAPSALSVDSARIVGGPHLVTTTMLVGQAEPVALCLPSAEDGSRVISGSWLETQLDDECTQVMRYASCEDDRCVSKDGHIIFPPIDRAAYICFFHVQCTGTDSFMRAFCADGRRLSSPVQPAARLRDDCHIAACVRRINHTRPGISLLRPRSPLKT